VRHRSSHARRSALRPWFPRSTGPKSASRTRPVARVRPIATRSTCGREAFHLAFDDVPLEFEPDGPGVSPAYSSAVSSWLWKHVWPLIADRDEWTPVVLWHNGQLYLQAEHAAGGLLDVDELVSG